MENGSILFVIYANWLNWKQTAAHAHCTPPRVTVLERANRENTRTVCDWFSTFKSENGTLAAKSYDTYRLIQIKHADGWLNDVHSIRYILFVFSKQNISMIFVFGFLEPLLINAKQRIKSILSINRTGSFFLLQN